MTQLTDKDGEWIFIIPIEGLRLTKEVNEEFVVNRVTFVTREKLPRIRKRLGLPATLSDLTEIISQNDNGFKQIFKDFFQSSKTFAVLPYRGKPKEKQKDCIRIVREELNILSLSQLGWLRRNFNNRIEIKTSDKALIYSTIDINKRHKEFTHGVKTIFNPAPFILDKKWISFHKKFFFFELLKIIGGVSMVSIKWRTILHRAAVMIGQSQNSNDLPFCLLWNVIALEMLLTKEGEKISDKLVSRCEYFLGWNEEWASEKYDFRIRNVYKKRCNFVHNGDIKLIEIQDLLFTDDLIFNILNNIVRYKNKIQDIKDIVGFSEKYEAEKLLNQKSKYQFGKFKLMKKHYSENDYKEI
ncbi:MAG TPA: hypothetical protein VMV56_12045 [Williamwhitmania sp.]|nr:hypothetical protein [Williamwhitmania sp.]